MRRVWFSKGIAGGDEMVGANDLGQAPFALLVEYVPPVKGKYRIKVRIKLRDKCVAQLIAKHALHKIDIYIDREAKDADTRQAALSKEHHANMDADPFSYLASHRPMWTFARKLATWVEQERTVKISFGTLLDGIEITGGMEELRRLARELTMGVDRLAAHIETGTIFDGGEVRIFAPGTRAKTPEKKPDTPPSQWGK
jgi:hypothetical protein